MTAPDDTETAMVAVRLANEIETVITGAPSDAVFIALSMVLGAGIARKPKADFARGFHIIHSMAKDSFNNMRRQMRTSEVAND